MHQKSLFATGKNGFYGDVRQSLGQMDAPFVT
jgi:hypothetical protein